MCSAGLQNEGGSYRQNTQNNITCLWGIRIGAGKKKGCLLNKDWLGSKMISKGRSWDQKVAAGSCWQILFWEWLLVSLSLMQVRKFKFLVMQECIWNHIHKGHTQLHFECLNHSYPILTFLNAFFYLMVKADAQWLFSRPQTGCFG